ncbi:MAG: nickel insertion protein [Chloroflexia bacterium]
MLLAYIDCFAGLSGETLLDALFSAGLSREEVDRALAALPAEQAHANGHASGSDLSAFRKSVAASSLPPVVKQAASAVLNRLQEAEQVVHNREEQGVLRVMGRQEWQGRELKAAIGVVLGLSLLGIGRVECSPLRIGGPAADMGTQTGAMLTFSPITAEILCRASVPVYGSEQDGEIVTPVGAALVTTLASSFGPLPAMTIRAIGYGKEEAGANGLSQAHRQTRIFVGERATVEVAPIQVNGKESQAATLKIEGGSQRPEKAATPPVAAVAAVAAVATAGMPGEGEEPPANGTVAKETLAAKPYISVTEEWVALSIKGHQQSGRQRL